MAKTADRVCETTLTTGTGSVTLSGAKPGYSTFSSAFVNTDQVYYCITDSSSGWETGIGTFLTSGPTLQRTTVITSSNANAAVSWSSGSKDVFCTVTNKYLNDMQDDILAMSIVFGG